MEKIINIDGKPCKFKTSASIPRKYRELFQRDIFVDMTALKEESDKIIDSDKQFLTVEALNLFENIAYTMHKYGDPSQPDNIDDWLDQFQILSIYNILPDILMLWASDNETLSEEKKI